MSMESRFSPYCIFLGEWLDPIFENKITVLWQAGVTLTFSQMLSMNIFWVVFSFPSKNVDLKMIVKNNYFAHGEGGFVGVTIKFQRKWRIISV